MIFLSSGLKYHDTTVRISNTSEGNSSFMELPAAIWENTAPDIAKKKPAYAHSLTSLNRGIKIAITPSIFQAPRMYRKYNG